MLGTDDQPAAEPHTRPMATTDDLAPRLAFAACAVLAGGNAVCVRVSNRELAPLWGAGLRFALAAGALWALARALRIAVPRGRALAGAAVYGLLNFGVAFGLAYYGLVRSPAGPAAVLLALVPLATLLLAAAHGQERLRAPAVVGGLLALAGVAIVSSASLGAGVPVASIAARVGSVVAMAEATVVARRFPASHPLAVNAVGMTVGAGLLVAAAAVAGEPMVLPSDRATWLALLYLVPAGSIAVFSLFLFVVHRWGATRAAFADVLIPVTTAVLAAVVLDEPVGWELVAGGAVILAGVWAGALRPAPQTPVRTAQPFRTLVETRRKGQA